MTKAPQIEIQGRKIGREHPPFVVAEIGINHEGDFSKAIQMVDDAVAAGCECVKFQSHVIEDEMIPNNVIPGNAKESIWEIMSRCAFSEAQERELMDYCAQKGIMFLSTPFSRAAADRLESMGVAAYKIGSGECNNYPLIDHIASFGKPIILSTGMNDIESIRPAVQVLKSRQVPFALLHCTSLYPTPYEYIRLGAIAELQEAFPDAVLGLSCHAETIYPCLGASALGASVLERHFTSSRAWPGPDIPVSMTPDELKLLIEGSKAIHASLGGKKEILKEEQPTIDFAYASVVAIQDIPEGAVLTTENLWVKRPGTGEILAKDFEALLGKRASRAIGRDDQIAWKDVA